MMNLTKTCMLAAAGFVALGAAAASLQAQTLIDSTFESDTVGLAPASPWTVTSITSPSSITVESVAQSPFSTGTRGLVWNDEDTTSWGPVAYAQFAAQSGALQLTFDFMLTASSPAPNLVINLGAVAGSASGSGPCLYLGRVVGKLQANNGSPSTIQDLANISTDTWYRVAVTVDVGEDTFDVSLQPYGGSSSVVGTGIGFRSEQTALQYVNIGDNTQTSAGGSVYLDNINVTAIPEPSSAAYALLALAGIWLFGRKLGQAE